MIQLKHMQQQEKSPKNEIKEDDMRAEGMKDNENDAEMRKLEAHRS